MQIDWITVSAQIVNFLVLVYLLQHFLYRPVIRAMDTREQRIADRLNNAEQREVEAREQIDAYRYKTEQMETNRRSLMEQYKAEAGEEKQRLLEQARNEVEDAKRQWQRQAAEEKRDFLEGLRKQTLTAVTAIARKALADLADASLEDRIVERFVRRLSQMDEATRRTFSGSGGALHVGTAFHLEEAQRKRIREALHRQLDRERDVDFKILPDLVCGIRLGDDGHALDWSLTDYLTQITESMDSAIENAAGQH
ncbi:MAG: F0F1 ATP synthase subunit delta [Arenicellales bacterium]